MTERRPRRGRLRRWLLNPWLFQTIVGAALIGAAVYEFDLRQVAHSFNDVRYQWLAAAFALYVMSRLLHAIEWRITLSAVGDPPILGLFGVLLIGTLVNTVVPASAGDVAKVQIVANRYGLPRSGLIAGRASEAVVNAVIMVGFIALSFALPGADVTGHRVAWILIAVAVVVFAATVAASRLLPKQLPRWEMLGVFPKRSVDFLREHWPRIHEGFEVIRNPRLLGQAVGLNLFGWAEDIFIVWLFGQAFQLDVPIGAYVSLSVAVAVITTFPITIGNIGTYELLLVSVLVLYGVSSPDALAFAIGTHVITAAFNVGLGLSAMWAMRLRPGDVFRMSPEPREREPAPAAVK